MHVKRLITAIIVLPLFYVILMYLPVEVFFCILVFFSSVALTEFYAMFSIKGVMKYTGMLWGILLLVVYFFSKEHVMDLVLVALLTIAGLRLLAQRDPSSSLFDSSAVIFGMLYIPGLLTFQLDLIQTGPEWVILLYASVWASDSMAYYVGKNIGRKKLYKEISPNKTVAGALGSLLGGILGAALITYTLLQQVTLVQTVIIGLVAGSSTVIGDLVESMFKRDAGIKDSGTLIPGHGGVLDKLDGVAFAGPALYWASKGLGLLL